MREAGTLSSSQQIEGRKARSKRSLSGGVCAAIIYVVLAGAPFLFGSKEPTTVAIWCALLGVGLVLAPTSRLERAHLLLLGGVAFIALCFAFVLHEQLSDHPWIASFNPIWAKASDALGRQLAPSVSIIRGEPFFALGHPLANVLALVLGIFVGVDSEWARRGTRVAAWAGVVYAIYGIISLVFDPTSILWREKTAYVGNLTATFINRNTAAAYFGSCAAVWLVLLMSAIRRNLPPGLIEWKKVPQHLLRRTRKEVVVRFVMLFVCLSAMFMTSSRGGVLVSLGVMMVTFMIYFARDMRRGLFVVAAVACIATVVLLLQVLGGNIERRIDVQGLSDAGRLSAYRSTLGIIGDNPWFGTGLGTFASAFPPYRSGDISMVGRWDIAHSTPLELASELGIPLALIVGAGWICALVILLLGSLGSRRTVSVPLSALAVSLIALLHSSIDFSLQIPGYSIVMFALLGLGLSQAIASRDNDTNMTAVPRNGSQRPRN